VIYLLQTPHQVVLLAIYAKSGTDGLTFAELKELCRVVEE